MSYVLQFFIAAVATVTFAILFAAPKKELIFCGISGGPGWFILFCTGSRGMWFWAVWWQPLF